MKDLRAIHNSLGGDVLAAMFANDGNFDEAPETDKAKPGHPPDNLIDAVAASKATQEAAAMERAIALLDARRLRLEAPPPKPVPVLKLCGQQISTAGNLTVLAGQSKGGKSAALGGAVAAMLMAAVKGCDDETAPWDAADCLGFEAAPMDGKALILFDTEQSPYDAWQNLSRAARRAGVESLPETLFAYRLLDVNTMERLGLVEAEMKRRKIECGGIFAVIIDGAADLALSVNDEREAYLLVEKLVHLAVKYDCPIIVVLHENPGSEKMRGHLGSQIERKAETNLRLSKGSNGVVEMFGERCRNAFIPKGQGAFFQWSDDAMMHVSCEPPAGKAEVKAAAEIEARDAAFAGAVGALAYADLRERIMKTMGIKNRASEGRIKQWLSGGLVAKDDAGRYRKAI